MNNIHLIFSLNGEIILFDRVVYVTFVMKRESNISGLNSYFVKLL